VAKGALFLILTFGFALAQVRTAPQRVMIMEATAFSRVTGPTAAGTEPHDGVVAADPRVLPLGSRIRVSGTTAYDGTYLVTDTGAAVKGQHIDLYIPSTAEAKQFGTKRVRVEILRVGKGKADAQRKDTASPPPSKNQ
jgi:3D (Asp-Asp-Asp) domain-containing protein